ncbi:DUF2975 domain-containing protein [Lacimicrobium alkaliphilum]|uniref:DUF2975 domain-containing protein n=1 Tax=Lacimicrobium alkaliphilum TaxID=1526571 RepID=A0ABQ1RLB9_9ALTE|nr:DUF2975 domain-containing protein [Lacimicrobium alkaliphilum]GGD73958.1 hypothetical protein GCM10011357_31250 [Lacimicrobium alkaliphilum]
MTRHFSLFIALGCVAVLFITPVAAIYLLIDIEIFASLARSNLSLPIQWHTVSDGQWYSLWLLTLGYVSIGLAGLYFLRRAFANFSRGQLFNHSNSRDLRLFAIMLFAQGLAKPVHFALASVLLSLNHPPGQKVLSVALGSGEVKVIALAMILWVMSNLLVRGGELEKENSQFI